jgi:hypothetical protein
VSFAAPSIVGDRDTYDAVLGFTPASWYALNLTGDQYTDNLADDPNRLTTTQRVLTASNAFHLPTRTDLNISGSLNTARGKPATALDNKTVTESFGINQAAGKHTVSLNVQTSQFRDNNHLAHDLDTQTLGLNANLSLPHNSIASLGETVSRARDLTDTSLRTSQSTSASYARPLWPQWTGQVFGSLTTTKNTSPSFPSDTSTFSINSETTWAVEKQINVTLGVGYNRTKDKLNPANDLSVYVLSARYSYSF